MCRTLSPVGKVAVRHHLGWSGASVRGPILLTGQMRSLGRGLQGTSYRELGWAQQNAGYPKTRHTGKVASLHAATAKSIVYICILGSYSFPTHSAQRPPG